MLNKKILDKLQENWGERANSLNCYAEVRFYDPFSSWSCYLFAMDPMEQDDIQCLVSEGEFFCIIHWKLHQLYSAYNCEGNSPFLDDEYRPIHMSTLVKRMVNKHEIR